MSHDEDVPPEEKEKWSLDRERDADAISDYMKVERVIGRRDGEDGLEYFVKCMPPRTPLVAMELTILRESSVLRFLHVGACLIGQRHCSEPDRPFPGPNLTTSRL